MEYNNVHTQTRVFKKMRQTGRHEQTDRTDTDRQRISLAHAQ